MVLAPAAALAAITASRKLSTPSPALMTSAVVVTLKTAAWALNGSSEATARSRAGRSRRGQVFRGEPST